MVSGDGRRHRHLRHAGAVLVTLALVAAPAPASGSATQREIFKRVHEAVERGDWRPVDRLSAAQRQRLENYVLWPDLRASWLRANLARVPAGDVRAFLDRYGTLKPARELRYRYALSLAEKGDLASFLNVYDRFYRGLGVARLDCLSALAEIDAGRFARATPRALDLWLVGTSQVAECDPVFEYLADRELLGPVEYRERFALAIEAREFRLARWLAKNIDRQHADEAAGWIQAQSNPERFLAGHDPSADSETYRAQLEYATERLTYRDPVQALRLWNRVRARYGFSEEQRLGIERHIALWTARDKLPGGYRLLARLPAAAQDGEVMRWRARSSLRDENWRRLLIDVAAMEPAERDAEEWRYWRAIALQRTGNARDARSALQGLSSERSYYGFLAADELGEEYALIESRIAADAAVLSELAKRPDIVRARELFLVGLDGRGRSEWEAAVRRLDASERLRAALLAHRWGWHSRAISTVAGLGEYDDLSIRYPLPWRREFENHASSARISPTWAYGVARSESLFMRDVRSSAGAVGLMQLMPKTGRQVAKAIRLPWSGLATLTDPVSNIRLGTAYLGQMAERFGGNRVLATAAYNAGPHRVDRWLPAGGGEDARIWIENIPFNETRRYVKRVLAAQAIFHWRMTGDIRRISDEMQTVAAAGPDAQLAARRAPAHPGSGRAELVEAAVSPVRR
ncbi:MAG: transglycosylase SLT domain-containing protein [Proteobacteria bacterium]|nr:transglycosylase SLT domain-containing protein [Pseudomonadota bacterium]